MNVSELLPYVFAVASSFAVYVGIMRQRKLRLNGNALENRIRDCEATIRTLLADNVRKEARIQELAQEVAEARQEIWRLHYTLDRAQLSDMPDVLDQARLDQIEEVERLQDMLRSARKELVRFEQEAAADIEIPPELQRRIAARKRQIKRYEEQLTELLA